MEEIKEKKFLLFWQKIHLGFYELNKQRIIYRDIKPWKYYDSRWLFTKNSRLRTCKNFRKHKFKYEYDCSNIPLLICNYENKSYFNKY